MSKDQQASAKGQAQVELVSPKKAAHAIGVSESSLKRWSDQGLFRTVKTAGGHRRIELSSILTFVRQKGFTLKDPSILGLPSTSLNTENDPAQLFDQLLESLEGGDELKARQLVISSWLGGRNLSTLFDAVMAPVFHEIGRRWERNELEVFVERRACVIATRILNQVFRLLPAPDTEAPRAVGGTLSGDPYTLASTMTELTLKEAGWVAQDLGADQPAETFEKAMEIYKPKIFWISIRGVGDAATLKSDLGRLHMKAQEVGCKLVVGGKISDEVMVSQPFSYFCTSMEKLSLYAGGLWRKE